MWFRRSNLQAFCDSAYRSAVWRRMRLSVMRPRPTPSPRPSARKKRSSLQWAK
jgi:hypothetical protein